MLETKDLILDKARLSDWKAMYENVWSRPECARYMMWRVTNSEPDAVARMERTIAFQKTHDTYLVYEKATGHAIGFAGVEQIDPQTCQETGICLGSAFVRRGYGGQILCCLVAYCREKYGAREFLYSTRRENQASCALAVSCGFRLDKTEKRLDDRDGKTYVWEQYRLLIP